jgi:hypothetical protein
MAKKQQGGQKSGFGIISPKPNSIYYVGSEIPVLVSPPKEDGESYVFVQIQPVAGKQKAKTISYAAKRNDRGIFARLFLTPGKLGKYKVVVSRTSDSDGKREIESQECELEVRKLAPPATVNAKHCLWFYTQGLVLPAEGPGEWKDPVSDSTPTAVIEIPSDATLADITVTSTIKTWAHGDVGTTTSDTDGYKQEQVRNEYYDFANPAGSPERINRIPTTITEPRLNELVGMLRHPGTDTYEQFSIGVSKTNVNVAGFSHLILGHHDGFEWKNNSGDITVTVDFHT